MTIDYIDTGELTGIDVFEEDGSPNERTTDNGLEATVTLRCNWADRLTILDHIIGDERLYPRFPASGARALGGTSRPQGQSSADGQGLVYPTAILTIEYGHGDEGTGETGGGDIISESLEPSAEFLTLDHTNFLWGNPDPETGVALEAAEAPGFLIVGFDYVQTIYNLATVPTTILSEIGKVNQSSQVASLLGLTFPAETLLYTAGSPSKTTKSDGSGKWNVTCRYSFRRTGWNKFWRPTTQTYESIYIKDNAEYKSYVPSSSLPLV